MIAFGELVAVIRPPTGAAAASLRYALSVIDVLGIDGMLRSVSVDCTKVYREIELAIVASDNWCENLGNGAAVFLDRLSHADVCRDVKVKFSDFPVSNQLYSEAHKNRIRSEQ